jgi:amidase
MTIGRSKDEGPGRRVFLARGAAAGAVTLAGGRPPLAEASSPRVRSFEPPDFEFEEARVAGLQEKMAAGELTSRRLAEAYLARIEALDRQGPQLRSVIETNPDALEIAEALDAERGQKGPRGPLHGIPVLLKDNVGTADRTTTTAGSLALEGSIPARDAHVAAFQ